MSKRSKIIIDGSTVIKTPLKWEELVFTRELKWLKKFKDANHFPTLINSNKDTLAITMSFCGEPLNKQNCPSNVHKQAEEILQELYFYKCCHNDIKPTELLVKNGKLYLIDFGWATSIGESIPSDWPPNLGGDFRYGKHNFDDRYSIMKSIEWVLE